MPKIIQLLELADGRTTELSGRYLVGCNVDARDGRGIITATDDPQRAHLFRSVPEAMSYWQRQSRKVPTRDDGQPNRPLTAYTIAILSREQAQR